MDRVGEESSVGLVGELRSGSNFALMRLLAMVYVLILLVSTSFNTLAETHRLTGISGTSTRLHRLIGT